MNESEIEAALRAGPPDEPGYQGGIEALLAERRIDVVAGGLDFAVAPAQPQRRGRWHAGAAFAAAAAVVVLVVAGLAVLGRARPEPPVSTQPATTPSTSAPTSTSPATTEPQSVADPLGMLSDRWVGPPREFEGIGTGLGANFLDIDNGLLLVHTGIPDNPTGYGSLVEATGQGELTFTLISNEFTCSAGAVGTYSWELSADGSTLTLTAEADECGARTVIEGAYTHTACPNPALDCLGPVPAGDHMSVRFDPTGASAHGSVRFTVPDGWAETDDTPQTLALQPTGASDAGVFLYVDPVVAPGCDVGVDGTVDVGSCANVVLSAPEASPSQFVVAAEAGAPLEVTLRDVGGGHTVAVVVRGDPLGAASVVASLEFL